MPPKFQRLIAPGEALADRGALDVDRLAGDVVVGGDLRAHFDQRIGNDAELGHHRLRLDQRLGEVPAQALAGVLGLLGAGAELQRDIAVNVLRALGHHLAAFERQHGDRHVRARLVEEPGHAELLGQHAGPGHGLSHRPLP
jgi:hypothetical protein